MNSGEAPVPTVHRSPFAVNQVPTPKQILDLKICDIAVGSAAFLVETCRQLADELVKSWRTHGGRPQVPPDETEELLAMRTIAQRCLYGVDRNSMAVDLAKLSLWLATLAKDHPFTFLDHAIRCGDSLVGLTRRQIEDFTWRDTKTTERQFFATEVRKRTAAALRERQNLLGLGDDYTAPQQKRDKLEKADELLGLVRFIGDAAVAAFFAAEKDKAREAKRTELAERIAEYLSKRDPRLKPVAEVEALRGEVVSGEQRAASSENASRSPLAAHPVIPFHWEIEYPEVFDRDNPGFDAIVGNPPFAGKNTLSKGNREGYLDWLKSLHKESHGNADLVAHFFRRAFDVIRTGGTFGLIATNTIGQGDTRASGLRWICTKGGVIYAARKRAKWPGQAAVVVSVLWVSKGDQPGPFDLDGRASPVITAYLFHAGGHENPAVLHPNENKSFIGSYVLGMGFTFDDKDKNGAANPLSVMSELLAQEPRNTERIFPYIGGEEVNDSPTHAHHRFVINFADFPLRREKADGSWLKADERQREAWLRTGVVPFDYPDSVAADWPDLLRIVEQKVKPDRDVDNRQGYRRYWWQFAEKRVELSRALSGSAQAMVIPRVTQHVAFTYLPTRMTFSEQVVVFAGLPEIGFVVLHSRLHESWSRFFASSLEERFRYTPSDCFDTFPFPAGFETNAALEAAGRSYYEFRAALMQDLWLGLTEIYNLFHSPDDDALARLEALFKKRTVNSEWQTVENVPSDRSPLTVYRSPAAALAGVRRLRELHADMDTAVLAAYGWTDLLPKCTCEFLLDYEDEESDSAEESGGRRKKKPWRYRWPDEFRDEVLARLLKLNAERAEQERLAGAEAAKVSTPKPSAKRGPKKSSAAPAQGELLPPAQGDLFG